MSEMASAQAQLTGCAPILLVADLQRAVEYWREKLGFADIKIFNQPPDFAICTRDRVTVMLALLHKGHHPTPHWKVVDKMWNAYIWVDDAKALYEEFQRRGATIDYTLHQKPYGCLEFGIQDLDGHDIAFGQITR